MNKSQHWYDRNGNACFEVPKAKGGGMRATTLADARKLGLYPSVTTIMSVMAKPQLDDWKLQQVAERAFSNPPQDGEEPSSYARRTIDGAFEQVSEGFDIRTDPPHDRDFFRGVGHTHFDGSVKSQASIADLFEKFGRTLEHEVGSEHPVAVMESGLFDMSSREEFLLAGEQGDLAHLHQVHADWILGRIDDAIVFGEVALGFLVAEVIFARAACGA